MTKLPKWRQALARTVKRREKLIMELAPDLRCAECGNTFEVHQLVVDHIDGVDFDRYAMSPSMRVARYWRQYKSGVALRALCNGCSCRDGSRRKHTQTKRWVEGQR